MASASSVLCYSKIPNQLTTWSLQETTVPENSSCEDLIANLRREGPFAAWGRFGPETYQDAPLDLQQKYKGRKIYGWKPGTPRTESDMGQKPIIVLGASQTEKTTRVYFTMAKESFTSRHSLHQLKPSTIDKRVYAISYSNFSSSAQSLCFQDPDINFLLETQYELFVDMSTNETKCKTVGQKIFDIGKEAANQNSWQGLETARSVCDDIKDLSDSNRARHIEAAWDGIGGKPNDPWTWRG